MAAKSSANPVTGTTTVLSVLGSDDGGEANLSYTWATAGTPPAAVSLSGNGNNAAKVVNATFSKAGTYSFVVTIRDAGGLTATSSVNVVVSPTLSSAVVAAWRLSTRLLAATTSVQSRSRRIASTGWSVVCCASMAMAQAVVASSQSRMMPIAVAKRSPSSGRLVVTALDSGSVSNMVASAPVRCGLG